MRPCRGQPRGGARAGHRLRLGYEIRRRRRHWGCIPWANPVDNTVLSTHRSFYSRGGSVAIARTMISLSIFVGAQRCRGHRLVWLGPARPLGSARRPRRQRRRLRRARDPARHRRRHGRSGHAGTRDRSRRSRSGRLRPAAASRAPGSPPAHRTDRQLERLRATSGAVSARRSTAARRLAAGSGRATPLPPLRRRSGPVASRVSLLGRHALAAPSDALDRTVGRSEQGQHSGDHPQ